MASKNKIKNVEDHLLSLVPGDLVKSKFSSIELVGSVKKDSVYLVLKCGEIVLAGEKALPTVDLMIDGSVITWIPRSAFFEKL